MKYEETTRRRNVIYKGKIVALRRDDALLPNGQACVREVVEHPGGACVLCLHEGKVVLVRQFRYAYGEELLEIPAGKLEGGEDPAAAAKRELEEETGLRAERMNLLFTLYPSPGYCDEKIYLYEAEQVTSGVRHPDRDEFLDVCELAPETAFRYMEEGVIRDAKTIVALLFLKEKLSAGH